jgi:protein-tyrosine phosphatase
MFVDLHTHILFNVDDGSKDIEQSLAMIEEEIKQDVHHIILTPHVQSRVTKVDRSVHVERFNELVEAVKAKRWKVDLTLGAEVLYRSHLTPDYDTLTFGKSKYLLLEFSTREEQPIEEIVYDISRMGFIPIVAHIERYDYLSFSDYIQIKNTGALIQVNTTSFLGLDKQVKPKLPLKMIKEGLVDLISSDTHNLDIRKPNLKICYDFLAKHVSEDMLTKIFIENPNHILRAISA